ncbi:hypothetical protein D778_01135 [Xanthomarina gelatinilytica]|uniref:Uncharacterized protein n=1 Tax=Xanthomarina gelatinilytica TaxID=1137281 RepID=M7N6R8_9FLAO|nr:hypothetical protein D778_01135 [Xanthomarina gelatinilytica]|tara:strand:+ start:405 stop:518 length:114 start_codon:yes stop_codon:yes gene_type:complete
MVANDKNVKRKENKILFMIVFLQCKTAKIEFGLVVFG